MKVITHAIWVGNSGDWRKLSRHECTRVYVTELGLTQSVTNAKEHVQKRAKVERFVWIAPRPFRVDKNPRSHQYAGCRMSCSLDGDTPAVDDPVVVPVGRFGIVREVGKAVHKGTYF